MDIKAMLERFNVDTAEMEDPPEFPVIRDIGAALVVLFENSDWMGATLVQLLTENADLKARVAALEGGAS
jgi:hypothetical protein